MKKPDALFLTGILEANNVHVHQRDFVQVQHNLCPTPCDLGLQLVEVLRSIRPTRRIIVLHPFEVFSSLNVTLAVLAIRGPLLIRSCADIWLSPRALTLRNCSSIGTGAESIPRRISANVREV